jgi:hypothetical protein
MSLNEIGTFTPEQARMLWQDYQERRQLQPQLRENFPRRRQIDEVSPHRVFVLNESEEEIPPYACLEITGTTVVAERTCLTVQKPTKLDGEYVFNSQFAIPASGEDESGVGWAYRYGIVRMIGDAPSEPKQFKPIVGSWEVEEGDGPFVVFGEDNAADDALVGRIGSLGGGSVIVKTGSGGIAAMSGDTPGSGTVTIYTYDGTDLVATSDTETAINISTTAHPANCYTTAKIAGGVYVLADPAVTDLRLSGLSLQLRRNCDWSTWHSGEECDEESGGGPEEEPLP